MSRNIRVIMVEDHPHYREGIKLALETETDIELTGIYGTAESALRELQHATEDNRPDIILLDLSLPMMGGIEALAWIKNYVPETKVIVLTQSDKESDVLRSIIAGASGYLLKSATLNEISDGIRVVNDGGSTLDAKMATYILNQIKQSSPINIRKCTLTERELEILALLSEGLLKKQISEKLNISTSTVATHIAHIYFKLKVRNAPAAIAKAFRTGLFG